MEKPQDIPKAKRKFDFTVTLALVFSIAAIFLLTCNVAVMFTPNFLPPAAVVAIGLGIAVIYALWMNGQTVREVIWVSGCIVAFSLMWLIVVAGKKEQRMQKSQQMQKAITPRTTTPLF